MANFFKKKVGGSSGQVTGATGIQITDSDAALAQSDFNTTKITEIQNKFARGSILLYPGRIFIREGILWKVCRKGPKKRQFFLFNDILVYGSIVANRYSNQHILPMTQMLVSAECFYRPTVDADFDEDSELMALDVANAFQISHADKSFHVFALSAADKANWLSNLHKHISRVSQSLSSEQQLLTKPVWVPDSSSKECMVCSVKFTAFIRKHHCRQCGRVICSPCSPHRVPVNSITGIQASDSKNMERICKDCFQERSSLKSRHATMTAPLTPPPPNVSAKSKTNVNQPGAMSRTLEAMPPRFPPGAQQDNSTDTEDSDDSDKEQESELDNVMETGVVETQPMPAPKQETELKNAAIMKTMPKAAPRKETEQKNVAIMKTMPKAAPRKETEQKKSSIVETRLGETQPMPAPRQKAEQNKVAVVEAPPTPVSRTETEQKEVAVKDSSVEETGPTPPLGMETEQKEFAVMSSSVEETGPTPPLGKETEQKEVAVMGSSVEETQPTPPPRKKKLKKKLEHIFARDVESENVDMQGTHSGEDLKDYEDHLIQEDQENSQVSSGTVQEAAESSHLDIVNKEMIINSSSKKSRRKKKYACHEDPTVQESNLSVGDWKLLAQNDVERRTDKPANEVLNKDEGSVGRCDTAVVQDTLEDSLQTSTPDTCQLELDDQSHDQSHDRTNTVQDAYDRKRSRKNKFKNIIG